MRISFFCIFQKKAAPWEEVTQYPEEDEELERNTENRIIRRSSEAGPVFADF